MGETVKIRTVDGVSDERRGGPLGRPTTPASSCGLAPPRNGTAVEKRLAYDDIERARTVFEWGPATPRSGKRKSDEKRERR